MVSGLQLRRRIRRKRQDQIICRHFERLGESQAIRSRKRLDTDGVIENISTGEWLALQQKLRGVLHAEAGKTSPYLEVLRHFVGE